jgi:hypothetical protein
MHKKSVAKTSYFLNFMMPCFSFQYIFPNSSGRPEVFQIYSLTIFRQSSYHETKSTTPTQLAPSGLNGTSAHHDHGHTTNGFSSDSSLTVNTKESTQTSPLQHTSTTSSGMLFSTPFLHVGLRCCCPCFCFFCVVEVFLATTELFIESGNVYIETKRNVDSFFHASLRGCMAGKSGVVLTSSSL